MENPYTSALMRIIELEDKLALTEARLRLAESGQEDAYRQTRDSFALLARVRNNLTDAILVSEIDLFYPRGEVTMKKDDDYCKCGRPKVRIHHDDLGRPVKYCAKCWNVVEAIRKGGQNER